MSFIYNLEEVEQAKLDEVFGGGISKIEMSKKIDARGDLTVLDFNEFNAFTPQRIFWITNVPPSESRGGHAHIDCAQFFIALKGKISIQIDDGQAKGTLNLASPDYGLLVSPLFWGDISFSASDAVLLVLASKNYDPNDYIHDYKTFCKIRETAKHD